MGFGWQEIDKNLDLGYIRVAGLHRECKPAVLFDPPNFPPPPLPYHDTLYYVRLYTLVCVPIHRLQSERASALSRLEESLKQKECDHHVDYQKLLSEIQAMRSDVRTYHVQREICTSAVLCICSIWRGERNLLYGCLVPPPFHSICPKHLFMNQIQILEQY